MRNGPRLAGKTRCWTRSLAIRRLCTESPPHPAASLTAFASASTLPLQGRVNRVLGWRLPRPLHRILLIGLAPTSPRVHPPLEGEGRRSSERKLAARRGGVMLLCKAPCGRGHRRLCNSFGWVRGHGLSDTVTPHPFFSVAACELPSPDKRAFTPVFDGLWGEGTVISAAPGATYGRA